MSPSATSSTTPEKCSDSDTDGSGTSTTTLLSNLSLRTLPSLPSLQNHSPSSPHVSYLCVSSLRPDHCNVTALSLSATYALLYSAFSSSVITVYDLATLAQVDSFRGGGPSSASSGSVKSLAFSGDLVFTAHQDSKIRVWQQPSPATSSHRLLASLPTLSDRLRRALLPGSYVRVRRHQKCLWVRHADAVSSLVARRGLLYSVSWDKSLKIWSAADLSCLESVTAAHDDAINAVAVADDGTVYTASSDCRIRVWRRPAASKRHSLVASLERHKSPVNALSLGRDGSVLHSGSMDRSILVWERDLEDSERHMSVVGALRGHGGAILCLINVEDLLFSGSGDRTVRIWRRGQEGSYSCLAVMQGHQRPVKSLGAVWDGKSRSFTVCSGSLDGEIRVWQIWETNPDRSSSSDSWQHVGESEEREF